ncbi:hypothetical protein V2J09_016929 [Rumex salicifolius]
MVGNSSKSGKGRQATIAKEVTGHKLKKGKQKVEEGKRMKEGMSDAVWRWQKWAREPRKNDQNEKVSIGPNAQEDQGPIKRPRAVYEPTPFAKPAQEPNTFAICKKGEIVGPSELGANPPLLLCCTGPQNMVKPPPSNVDTDSTLEEPKHDAETTTENEMEVRPASSRMSITLYAVEMFRSRRRNFPRLHMRHLGFFGMPICWICKFLVLNNTLFAQELLSKAAAFRSSLLILPPPCTDDVFSELTWRQSLQISVNLFSQVETLTSSWTRRRDRVALVICTMTPRWTD